MFIVYKSNELDRLLLKICQIIYARPLSNPFEKEVFVHENESLFQYLYLFIAKKKGISANFKFYNANVFLWRIFSNFAAKKTMNAYQKNIMIWNIMHVIEKNNCYHTHKIHTALKKFQFSFLMAKLFEKYIFYRPQYIDAWDKSDKITNFFKNEEWQKELWIALVKSIQKKDNLQMHYGNIMDLIIKLVASASFPKKKFPTRIFFISSFTLHPLYINILEELGKKIDIYLFHITPCKEFFIVNSAVPSCILTKSKNKFNDSNNILMNLWGQYEQFYTFQKNPTRIKIINDFKKKTPLTLLNIIQNDILETKKKKIDNKKIFAHHRKRYLSSSDTSISVNICYHEQHEIEILYEKLSSILRKNSDISPGDIIVTSTDIKKYIPFIQNIFQTKKSLPFFISNQTSKQTEIILSTFNKIFNLPTSRFDNQEIIALLDVPEVAHKFNICEEEIEILYHWIDEVNIRWGFNEQHQNSLLSVTNKKNTWMYGIEKLLCSYSINKKNKIWNNILSCISINGSRSELIGKIAHFTHTLDRWRKKLLIPKTFQSWSPICNFLINDFFKKNDKIQKSLIFIQKKWEKMIRNGLLSNYNKKISFNVIKLNFKCIINTIHTKKFIPGVINFCDPSSVYYIPCKILYIIGMNRNDFPRKEKVLNFNLLHRRPSIGDPDISIQDSYLFLHNLSCAQKYFYISYIQFDAKCNIKKYPSIFIDQLLEYILNNFCFRGDQKQSTKENKQKTLDHIVRYHQYQLIHHINKKNIVNHEVNKPELFLKTFNRINYKILINFWIHPIRYYYNTILQNNISPKKKEIKTIEPFLVDNVNRLQINDIILNAMIHNQDITQLFQYYKFSGILPFGTFGKIFWNKQINDMKNIADAITPFRIETKSQKFQLKIKKYYLCGTLSEIQQTGLLRWRTRKINYYDRMSLWLEHLIYCILGGTKESQVIGLKNTHWSFTSLTSDIAYRFLYHYITGYEKGTKKPLWLIQSGAAWFDQVYDKNNSCMTSNKKQKKKGYYTLLNYWHGNHYYKGEKNDIYIQKMIPEINSNSVKKICSAAKKWLLPILKYKK